MTCDFMVRFLRLSGLVLGPNHTCSSNKCLLSTGCVPGSMPGVGDIARIEVGTYPGGAYVVCVCVCVLEEMGVCVYVSQ